MMKTLFLTILTSLLLMACNPSSNETDVEKQLKQRIQEYKQTQDEQSADKKNNN